MCPHCNRPLAEEATFCNECGRRVEGWQGRVAAGGAPDPSQLPDGEVETREMNISPEMLRAAGKKAAPPKGKPASKPSTARPAPTTSDEPTDSSMLRAIGKRRSFMPAGIVIAAVAMGVAVYLAARHRQLASAPTETPPAATAPVGTTPPVVTPPTTKGSGSKKKGPKKLAAEAVDKGATDSKDPPPKASPPVATPKDSGKAPATTGTTGTTTTVTKDTTKPATTKPSLPSEDLPSDATPMTEDELKEQETARLNADQVRYVVKQHLSQVRACYERQFKQSSPGGRLEVSFAIGEDGKAKRIRSDVNTTGSEPFARCIEGLVAGWTFPKPMGGEFELTYPFVFSSGS